MTSTRTTRRTALAAGLTLALGLGMTATASAGGPRTVTGKPTDPITRIADFYGAYIDAQSGEGGGKLAEELRKYYLTPALQKELKAWEKKNNADGVLRAQNTPVQWKVTDNGTANHTEAGITFTWGSGRTTKLVVDMNRKLKIFHIGTKGAAGS
ncbi:MULTISPECIES: hypothetical protein [Streptomyces]|uniref:Secreted protein n=1 Tax=Streptomyces griseiscabiei TaxID=2993540 RepID=A0ABU4L2X9_9ACTN|nr:MULTISPECIES: hypothetical protein [Streptomyces]MBZ3901386.1 hypothetical protein [Streptomyces griseiscabiei]MDX2910063.1 hypothetical protein [Streptomyces griseiscabiei]